MCSVDGSVEAISLGIVEQQCNTILLEPYRLPEKEQHLTWWLGWGGTPLKMYQGRPKVCSEESEILRRMQR